MKIGKNYKVIKKISETSRNIIYKVHDEKNDSVVALKMLKNDEPSGVSQFKKEYYILHTLSHPNIVEVYDMGVHNVKGKKQIYFTMEYIDGTPFGAFFANKGHSSFISVFLDTLGVLRYIHNRGYIHCDLKPNHLIISKTGKVKLVDFGFAQLKQSIISDDIGGTLQYIAPEILKGEKPDVRTDIYSLGIIAYEALMGKEVFKETKTSQLINAVLSKGLKPIKKVKGIPSFIYTLVVKMAEKQRINRFSNVDTVIKMIDRKGKSSKEERVIEKLLFSDFVGRKRFLDFLDKILKTVSKGEGQIRLIEGITGTGKTRLLKEIEHRMFLGGKDVHYIRITNKGKFNFDWLLEFLEQSGENVDEVEEKFERGEYSLSGNEKYKFFERMASRITDIYRDKSTVLLLDDVDLSDKTMIDFLLYISVALERIPMLLVAATERIPEGLNDIIYDKVYGNVSKEELGGLSRKEILVFVKNMLGVTENSETLCDFLYEKTAGNPFFVEELLGEILCKKLLRKELNRLICNLGDIKKVSIPETLELFVNQGIRKISKQEQEILKLLSVFGDSMPLQYLFDLSPFNESETASTLEMYSLKEFLSLSEDGKIDFSHRLVRNIVYKRIHAKELSGLHETILKFLEKQNETLYILHQKALHSYAIRSEKAVLYLKKILKKALKSENPKDAIDAFEKLEELGRTDVLLKEQVNVLLNMGFTYIKSGATKKAVAIYERLLKGVKTKKDRYEILHHYAVAKMYLSTYEGADEILENLLKRKLSRDMRIEVTMDLGWFRYSRGNYERAEELYKTVLKQSKKGLKKKSLLGKLYYNICLLKQETGDFKQAETYARKVLEVGESNKSEFYLVLGLTTLAMLEQRRRNYDKAISYYIGALKLLEKTEDIPRKLNVLSNLSRFMFSAGNIEESKQNYTEAIIEAKKVGHLTEIGFLLNLYARILSRDGDWFTAIDSLEKSGRIAQNTKNKDLELNNIIESAIIYAFQEESEKLETLTKRALLLKRDLKENKDMVQVDLLQGIKRFAFGDFKESISYFDRLEKSAGKVNVPEYLIPGLLYKSLCLSNIGRRKAAVDAVLKAKEVMRKTKMFLYNEEVEFIRLVVAKEIPLKELREKLMTLLERTKKNQGFLFARILKFLGQITCEDALRNGKKTLLTESISFLKEARKGFKEMNARVFLWDITDSLAYAYERLTELNAGKVDNSDAEKILTEFCHLVEHINNPEKLKDTFISTAKSITGAERGLFLTLDNDSGELVAASEDVDSSTIDDAKAFSRSVIKRVAKTRKPLIAYDAVNDRDFDVYESVRINKIRSILCIPVVNDDKVLGALYLDSRKSPMLFSTNEERFFTSLATLLADSLTKALDYSRMKQQSSILKQNMRTRFGPLEIIGKSEKMQDIFDKMERFGKTDVPVLVLGETGTGKELVARSIHSLSKRKENNFLVVDCSAISASLLESELFGHRKGAFTGAVEDKMGQFEAAKEGTIFIDEIANASKSLQSRLLRFLDTQEVKRIGATKYRKIDARIIVASNKDLYKLVKKGKFSEDLFYRLSKFVLSIPPLRKRKEDISLLVDYYIRVYNKKYSKNIKGITKEVQKLFIRYNWRGNVRELINEVSRCVFFCSNSMISKEYLSDNISKMKPPFLPLKDMKRQTESDYIRKAVSFTSGNITKAARILKTDKKTVYRNLKKS